MVAEGEQIVKHFGKVMYTLLYLKWITNTDLLYSTWNSAQCYVPAWMGGRFGGEQIYVRLSPFTVHMKLSTTLLIDYTPIQKIFLKLPKKKKRIMQNKQTKKKRQPHEVGRVSCPFCWKVKWGWDSTQYWDNHPHWVSAQSQSTLGRPRLRRSASRLVALRC